MKEIRRDLFRPVATKRTFEDISDQIKGLIYSKALKPQDRLPAERELAARFNTGRFSVREALRILEESGFVSIKQGADGGVFVKELDSTGMTKSISGLIEVGNLTLLEITEARISIESIILESAIKNITKEQLDAFKSNIHACERLRKNIEDDPKETWIERLRMFHVLLGGLSKNRLYKYMVKSLIDLYNTYIKKLEPQIEEYYQHLDQHKAIFEAIKTKDLKRAQNALRDHLYSLTKSIIKDIMKSRRAFDRWTL